MDFFLPAYLYDSSECDDCRTVLDLYVRHQSPGVVACASMLQGEEPFISSSYRQVQFTLTL